MSAQGAPRHLVLNTLVTAWGDGDAGATNDVVLVMKDNGWAITLVGRYHDDLHHRDGT